MRVLNTNDDFSGNELKMSDGTHWDMDPNQNMEYLGEVLVWTTSILLRRFGGSYHDVRLQPYRSLTS